MEAILDSGTIVAVIPPPMGRGYQIAPSEASIARINYEVLNG